MKFVRKLSEEDKRALKDEIGKTLWDNISSDYGASMNVWGASEDLVHLFEEKILEAMEAYL